MFENQLGLQEQLDVMKQYGIIFDTGAPIRGILANDSIDQLANDAAMVTAATAAFLLNLHLILILWLFLS